MNKSAQKRPDYGNWVSDQRIIGAFRASGLLCLLGMAALFCAVFGWLGKWAVPLAAVFLALCLLTLVSGVYFRRARKLFSPEGGDVQRKVVALVLDRARWGGQGSALDIGCGSGALAIGLAKRFPEARVSGVDYWGGTWGYDQKQCEENAALEGVSDRMEFTRASASALPFEDSLFDLVVSNLVFHEVRDTRDKRECVREALRVLKPGGCFVLQDLFLIEQYYGKPDELVAYVKSCGASEVEFVDTSKSEFIPKALRLPFMVGTLGMLAGVK